MKIKCLIKRPGGTHVKLEGVEYRFLPPDHIADVERASHAQRLLSITEAYRLVEDGPHIPAGPAGNDDNTLTPNDDEPGGTETGAVQGGTDDTGADDTGTGEGEGEQDDVGEQDEKPSDAPAEKQVDEREELAAIYFKRFGKKPHHKQTAEHIRKALEEAK